MIPEEVALIAEELRNEGVAQEEADRLAWRIFYKLKDNGWAITPREE